MTRVSTLIGAAAAAAALALALIPPSTAQAYVPTGTSIYQLPSDQACLKGRGNCAIYPKSAQLPDRRLVASFEQSTVAPSGSADGQTLPIYTSDDYGDTWKLTSQVKAPAYMSSDPKYAPYVSNWTNPYLYVLPQDVGTLKAGTLVMATIVSGDDAYYTEHKAADPTWTPSNDGDRSHMAMALYASTDDGASWSIVNIIATGGWEGGSAGALGKNIAAANTYKQIDPIWEPYLMVYDGKLVCYYSDENDYTGYDPSTGVASLAADNDTAADSGGQILAHRTWDGSSTSWTDPVVDVSGLTQTLANGSTEIGGGRPGMANVVQTSDGKWMITYEYWGGGGNVRYKVADDPLDFFKDGSAAGTPVTSLPVSSGSKTPSTGGSPVLVRLPSGALVYNASGSGDIWVNRSGSSTGTWTEYQTTTPGAYSRNLQYVNGTGKLSILYNQGTSTINSAQLDLGGSDGTYYELVNRKTGEVLGTGGNTTDANIGNKNVPDVVSEAAAGASTQAWHLTPEPGGGISLLNKSGGRAAEIWTGAATQGQKIGQWVDNSTTGTWNLVADGDYYRLQSVKNSGLYLSGATADAQVTLQPLASDGSDEWTLVPIAPTTDELTTATRSSALVPSAAVAPGGSVSLDASASTPGGAALHAGVTGHAYLFDASGAVTPLGAIAFGQDQKGTVTLPADYPAGKDFRIAVTFDTTALMWGQGTTVALPAAWSSTAVYHAGDTVSYNGKVYRAAWYTSGEKPGTSATGAWQEIATTADGVAVWTSSRIFNAGDTVSYRGKTYRAAWWTRNDLPGSVTGPWEEIATTADGTAVWTPSRIFNAADKAVYQGTTYIARWYSRDQAPGTGSAWALAS